MKEKIKCENCNGDGWYADHTPAHYMNSGCDDCGQFGCPCQVECERCEGKGFIEIEVEEIIY